MRYILNPSLCFRGWYKQPTGLLERTHKETRFFSREEYLLLLQCDGAHDIASESLTDEEKRFFGEMKEKEIIRDALPGELIRPEQEYRSYPNRYRKSVQWSITGSCNFNCLHCFMSAPHNKHGNPSLEELIGVADQLKECGIFSVGITGGEPLIREDFFQIVKALLDREIEITTIYTNGALLDESFLDMLESNGAHPAFQLSFDGVGFHDFLRGVPGSEEKTIAALKLLQQRNYPVSVSTCLHRKNARVLRETVNLMASLGVRSMKCGPMQEQGEWLRPEIADLKMQTEETMELFESYIPQYFEDDAPLSIMLGGAFMYTPMEEEWNIFYEKECSAEEEAEVASCGVLQGHFYIGPEGNVAPCMSMNDCEDVLSLPNLKEVPLREILRDSEFTKLCDTTVGEVRDRNPKCRTCQYMERCTGGCRAGALIDAKDYYGIETDACQFFELGWNERIRKAAQPAFEKYWKKHKEEAR